MAALHGPALCSRPGAPASLAEALRQAADREPARGITFIAEGGESRQTYRELLDRAEGIARGLRTAGVRPGHVIALDLESLEDQIAGFWGTVLAGAVALPSFHAPRTGASLPPGCRWRVSSHRPTRAHAERGSLSLDELDTTIEATPLVPNPDDLALLLETSGSTGAPKRVMHTHRTLIARSAASVQGNGFDASDVSLNWLPLDHVGGLVMFHLRDVYVGCEQIQAERSLVLADPTRWLDWLERFRATITWGPSSAFALVSARAEEVDRRRRDLSSVRFVLNGGEGIVARHARRFLQLLGPHGLDPTCMHPAWGMSETGSGVVYAHDFGLDTSTDDDAFVAVGTPLPGVSVRVVDDGRSVPEGEVGNLEVRGPSITLGYHDDPEATRRAFTPDGWLRTGDQAMIAAGNLTLTGREKDVVILGGVNHAAQEIENVVDTVDGVLPALSCAIAGRRDRDATDRLVVFVCPSDTATADVGAAVRARLRETLGIESAQVIELSPTDLPRTSIGKIARKTLAERFRTGAFDVALPASEDAALDDAERVRTIVAEILATPPPVLDPETPLCDQAGLDSLTRLEIVTALERAFSVRLPSPRVEKDVRVRDLAELVAVARAGEPNARRSACDGGEAASGRGRPGRQGPSSRISEKTS